MTQTPLISIIVPVYNAEPFLSQCLDSILGQQLESLEVFLIDDGSTDGSGIICDAFARRDHRIRVKHQTNTGVSEARNTGMELAVGEYIAFVDADDWIEPGMFSDLLALQIRENADMVMCSYSTFFKNSGRENLLQWDEGSVLLGEEIKEKLIPSFIAAIDLQGHKQKLEMGAVWRAVFRREFLKLHQLCFDTRIKYMEDLVFMVHACSLAQAIAISRYPYYYYQQNKKYKTSATRNYTTDKYESRMLCVQEIEVILQQIDYLERLQMQIDWRYCLNVINSVNNICSPGCPLPWNERVRLTKYYLTDSHYKRRAARVGYKYFTVTQKIAVFLLRASLINTAILAYTLKNRVK